MTVEQIKIALRAITQAPASEIELHQKMERCFTAAGIACEREVATETGPVDFVLGGSVALEVKVRGSAMAVCRQVIRYLQDPRFAEAVIVTTRPMTLPLEAVQTPGGVKPIQLVELWRNFF
jgi:hypothetical protein